MRRIVIVGTDTSVGKTWTTAALAKTLIARGNPVIARKPCQSYDRSVETPDSEILAAATGDVSSAVCSDRWTYPIAMAPPIAAAILKQQVPTLELLYQSLLRSSFFADSDCLIEMVGGVRSPLAADGDTAVLTKLLRPSATVLVSPSGLGALNSVRLSLGALFGLTNFVFLNRFDEDSETHQANLSWLTNEGIEVTTSVEELADMILTTGNAAPLT